MRPLRVLVFASASFPGILFFLPVITQAQQTSTINGMLTDPSGAAIVGAIVVARPLDTAGANASAPSGPDGKFSVVVTAGRYRVSIQHPSFKREEQEFYARGGRGEDLGRSAAA